MSISSEQTNFKNFFTEKILPNFLIWAAAAVVGSIFEINKKENFIKWKQIFDLESLWIFALGVGLIIILLLLFVKIKESKWFFSRTIEELYSAIVNISSIAVVSLLSSENKIINFSVAIVGYLIAWIGFKLSAKSKEKYESSKSNPSN